MKDVVNPKPAAKLGARSEVGSRVVVFTEMFHPETISTAYYLTEIARGLATVFPVEVVTAKIAGEPLVAADGILGEQVRIHRCAPACATKKRLWARGVAAAWFCVRAFCMGMQRVRRGDVVFTVTNPPMLPYIATLVGILKSARVVLLVHDVYPELLVAIGFIRAQGIPHRLLNVIARWFVRRADCVIVLGRDMEQLLLRKGCSGAQLRLVPNWAEVDAIPVLAKSENRWLTQLGLADRFIVLYAGNLGRTHDVSIILDAARLLQDQPGVHFLMAGFPQRVVEVQAAVERESLTNVSAVAFAFSRQDQVQTLSAGDVAVISLVPGMAGISVPSRMYNVMAAGRPIIAVAEPDSELGRVVTEEAIGWVVRPGDARGLAKAVQAAREYPERTRQMGERAARAAREKYSMELALEEYRAAVHSVSLQSES